MIFHIVGTGGALKNLYRELGVKNILLVEDDPWTRESLSLFFQIQGCRLRSAANAEEAIASLSADRYDLILCEYWLPDMDGLEILAESKKISPQVPVVMLSGFGDVHPGPVRVDESMTDF